MDSLSADVTHFTLSQISEALDWVEIIFDALDRALEERAETSQQQIQSESVQFGSALARILSNCLSASGVSSGENAERSVADTKLLNVHGSPHRRSVETRAVRRRRSESVMKNVAGKQRNPDAQQDSRNSRRAVDDYAEDFIQDASEKLPGTGVSSAQLLQENDADLSLFCEVVQDIRRLLSRLLQSEVAPLLVGEKAVAIESENIVARAIRSSTSGGKRCFCVCIDLVKLSLAHTFRARIRTDCVSSLRMFARPDKCNRRWHRCLSVRKRLRSNLENNAARAVRPSTSGRKRCLFLHLTLRDK